MSDAKHTPSGDRSFAASVAVHLAAGVALIAVVAGAFWGLGRIGREPAGPVIASSPTEAEEPSTPAPESPEASPTATASEPASPTPTEPSSPAETATDEAFDPASVSMQVLDATGGDGAAAEGFADRARDDDYRVVAVNRAIRVYERTTVFWSPGHEAEARRVAAQYGFAVVEEKPDNLTSSVDVHVVIGEDYEP